MMGRFSIGDAIEVAIFAALAVFFLVSLAGCDATLAVVDDRSQQAATKQWAVSENAYCRANSTGELLRKAPEEADRYLAYCRGVLD